MRVIVHRSGDSSDGGSSNGGPGPSAKKRPTARLIQVVKLLLDLENNNRFSNEVPCMVVNFMAELLRKAGTADKNTDKNTLISLQLPPLELAFCSSLPVWPSLSTGSLDLSSHQSPVHRITMRDEEPDRRRLPAMFQPQLPEDEFGPQDPSSFTGTGAITPFVGTPATGAATTTAAAATSQSQQQVPSPPHKRSSTRVGRSSSPPTGGRQRTLSGRTPAARELILSPSRQPVTHATSPSMEQAQSPQATFGPSLDEPFPGQTSPLPPSGGGLQTSTNENQAAATSNNGNLSRDRTAEAAGGSPLIRPQPVVQPQNDPMQVADTRRRGRPAPRLMIDQRIVISGKVIKAHLRDTRPIVRNRPVVYRPTGLSAVQLLRRPAVPGRAPERVFADRVNQKRPHSSKGDRGSDSSSDDAVASASLASNSMHMRRAAAADDGSTITPAADGVEDLFVPVGSTPGSTDSRAATPLYQTPSIHAARAAGPVDDADPSPSPMGPLNLQTSRSSTPVEPPARSSVTSNLSGPTTTSLSMPPIEEDVETLAEDVRKTSLGVDNETTFFTVCPHSRSRMVATMKYMALLVGVERGMFDMRQEVPYQDITIRYNAMQL